ncbi:MAG: DMT family transporter [Victivallales bacterium]|nr:DMT family transporter [Victivallales bacterium]
MSSWFLLTLVSAIALGLYDLGKKHAVKDNSLLPVLFWSTLCGAVSFLLLIAVQGQFVSAWHCDWAEYWLIWVKGLLVAGSWYCGYAALRVLPISLASPIRATAPLWVFFGGVCLYHEFPNGLEALGMLLIFSGYFALNALGSLEGFSIRHPGIQYCLAGTLLGAGSALYDKFLLNTTSINPLTVQLYFSLDVFICFAVAWAVRRLCHGPLEPLQWRWTIPATGMMLIVSDFTYFHAVSLPDIQISQISLIRRSSCLLTFFLGAYLFHDRNVGFKSLALALILAGVTIMALV